MYLYHGGISIIKNPSFDRNKYLTDFGPGFYLTADKEQAISWSKRKAKKEGIAVVNIYSFSFDNNLSVLDLKADINWVKYVYQNRSKLRKTLIMDQDIVIGPTADGELFSVIYKLDHDKINLQDALEKLKPLHFKRQYCFKTQKAIKQLKFLKGEVVRNETN